MWDTGTKPRTALLVLWDSTAVSLASPVLPKHILHNHPKKCTCCIISTQCRTSAFFLFLMTTTSNVSLCISVHRWAQHLCAQLLWHLSEPPNPAYSAQLSDSHFPASRKREEERTLQGDTVLGTTKLEREKPKRWSRTTHGNKYYNQTTAKHQRCQQLDLLKGKGIHAVEAESIEQ